MAVASLPKGGLVEKQVFLHTGRFEVLDEDGDKELQNLSPKVETGMLFLMVTMIKKSCC